MDIRPATDLDAPEIIDLYQRSQDATRIPNPDVYPRENLGAELYSRDAIERYVAIQDDTIVGHGLIEKPNPVSVSLWMSGIADPSIVLIEFGGAFVDPNHMRRGIYTELLRYRLNRIRELNAVPVSATWGQNIHVQRRFISEGGREVARQQIPAGELCLFVFD